MTEQTSNNLWIIFYIISIIIMVSYGVLEIINEKEKEYPNYSTGIIIVLAGLTPGSMIVTAGIIFVGIIYLLIEVPNKILKKLLNQKKI